MSREWGHALLHLIFIDNKCDFHIKPTLVIGNNTLENKNVCYVLIVYTIDGIENVLSTTNHIILTDMALLWTDSSDWSDTVSVF